jgi:hypothetical protein
VPGECPGREVGGLGVVRSGCCHSRFPASVLPATVWLPVLSASIDARDAALLIHLPVPMPPPLLPVHGRR